MTRRPSKKKSKAPIAAQWRVSAEKVLLASRGIEVITVSGESNRMELDEFVALGGAVHLERMGAHDWCLILTERRGTKWAQRWTFGVRATRGGVRVTLTEGP